MEKDLRKPRRMISSARFAEGLLMRQHFCCAMVRAADAAALVTIIVLAWMLCQMVIGFALLVLLPGRSGNIREQPHLLQI
jgi:hypothetical protein